MLCDDLYGAVGEHVADVLAWRATCRAARRALPCVVELRTRGGARVCRLVCARVVRERGAGVVHYHFVPHGTISLHRDGAGRLAHAVVAFAPAAAYLPCGAAHLVGTDAVVLPGWGSTAGLVDAHTRWARWARWPRTAWPRTAAAGAGAGGGAASAPLCAAAAQAPTSASAPSTMPTTAPAERPSAGGGAAGGGALGGGSEGGGDARIGGASGDGALGGTGEGDGASGGGV